jgi:AcrR family transcriptional regulator
LIRFQAAAEDPRPLVSTESRAMEASPALDPGSQARRNERSASRVLEAAPERRLDRSRRIALAAGELLSAHGLEGLTLRAVLERTGLSRRAFYECFDGMDDLLLAVFEETMRQGAVYQRALIAEASDPLERLRLLVVCTASDAWSARRARYSAVMSREHLRLAGSRPQELRRALEPMVSLFAEQLAAGMARGQVRPADPAQLALLVFNLVAATIHTALLGPPCGPTGGSEPPEHVLWEFCRRAVST